MQNSCTALQTKTMQSHSEPCAELKDGRPVYDFTKCLAFLEGKGKELFGEHFKIYKEDHYLIYRLLLYMIGDKENAAKHRLNLKKGILLTGPVGCGKTSLMKLLRYFQTENMRYAIKSCREISFEFKQDGFEVIHQYSKCVVYYPVKSLKAYCFDDLGTESNLKYYGNECNVLAEILLSRYDLFVEQQMATHVTTNLNSSEIEQYYGNRVRSRMREMLNLVAFDKHAKDKRV